MKRPPDNQQLVDETTQNMILYHFRMCPFCVTVRRAIKRLSLNIDTRDALRDESSREQLLKGGGVVKVPCLRIADESGKETWMYESTDIIQYLQKHFA
jgi:glutaredoxin